MPPSHAGLQLEYALVDVFAERPLEGNMLAIFTDARGLTTEQMQALAREMNLAETTFILPPNGPTLTPEKELQEGVRVRIFTTQEELPFAGHPTLGTASWLYWNHPTLRGAATMTLALNVGPIQVAFRVPDPHEIPAPGVFATMRQRDPSFDRPLDQGEQREEVAGVLGLHADDLHPSLPVQVVSTGMAFCIVPMRSLAALRRLSIPQAVAQPWLERAGARFFYCFAPADAASGADFQSRMQFYNGEDPATGSAAGCLIAYLVRHGVAGSGMPIVIEQGMQIARPSRIHVRASLTGRAVTEVFVGGRTIPVASGRFFLP